MADSQWIVDSLIQFLQSPMWQFHVENFIDQNCLIFDTEEENKFTYTDVYKSYQSTVEKLLQEYMNDIGITSEQLEEACTEGMANKHQHLFQYLLAMDDFLLFKRIMVQRNTQLNEEAMKLVSNSKQMQSSQKDEFRIPHPDESDSLKNEQDDRMLADVLLKSKVEHEDWRQLVEEEQRLIKQATEESLKTYQIEQERMVESRSDEQLVSVEENVDQHGKSTPQDIQISSTKDDKVISTEDEEPKTINKGMEKKLKSESGAEAVSRWLESARNEIQDVPADVITTTDSNNSDLMKENLKTRELYLKKQRDRLLALKTKEREQAVKDYRVKNKPNPLVKKSLSPKPGD